ncbi:MAG: FMN-binding protein [Clostridiales bacterium]|nr:FMN-binding protein [Clostridiales bacterium]
MKRGHVYTLFFMTILTAVLVFALAAAYEAFKPSITTNKLLQEQRAVLYALGIDDDLSDEEVRTRYAESVQPGAVGGITEAYGQPVLAHMEGGNAIAYAVPFEGSGLWGSLRGYLGITADLTETRGLVFTYQNETPGLGGRIDESWFKEQFRNLPIAAGVELAYGANPEYKIDAVTGATQTSSAVMRTINKSLSEIVFPKEVK